MPVATNAVLFNTLEADAIVAALKKYGGLTADNGIHASAYDAVIVTVQNVIQMNIQRSGTNVALRWTGGAPPFDLQRAPSLPAMQWVPFGTFATNAVTIPRTSSASSFRVRGQ